MGSCGVGSTSKRMRPRNAAKPALALAAAGGIAVLASCAGAAPGFVPTSGPATISASPATARPTETALVDPDPTAPGDGVGPSPSAEVSPPTDAEPLTIITLDVVDGQVQATGILPGTVGGDGECVLTLRRGDEVRSATVPVTPGRDSIYCGQVAVATTGLAPGEWTAVLAYRSLTRFAQSSPAAVTLP